MLFFMITGEAPSQKGPRQPHIDEALFVKIGEGSSAALEELYRTTERTIYAYTLSLLKNPDNARDAVQETYLKIRACAHLYRPMGKPLAWMFTIAGNLCRNFLRVSGRTDSADELLEENHPAFSYVTDPTDRLVLEEALKILGPDERQILLLHAVSGMKHCEIAENLSIPLSTALSKYHRALKKMKKHLLQMGQEDF